MVRLRRWERLLGCNSRSGFQSHYGAIATGSAVIGRIYSIPFQSHYGAIATEQDLFYLLQDHSFNPTMVRLRLAR